MSEADEAITWELRRRTLICCESILRIMHDAVGLYRGDLEAFIIFLAVTAASVGGAHRDAELLHNPPPPGRRLGAQYFRAVSRRAIAASTGLPRETVRRKIATFIDEGLLVAQGSYVRIPPDVLEHPRNLEFARMLAAEFSRTAAQLERIPPPN